MKKITILGWNDYRDGFYHRHDFESAPIWLRILATTPFLERFAYPIGVKKNYVWLRSFSDSGPQALLSYTRVVYGKKTIREEIDEGWVSFSILDSQEVVQKDEYEKTISWLGSISWWYRISPTREGMRVRNKIEAWNMGLSIFNSNIQLDKPNPLTSA